MLEDETGKVAGSDRAVGTDVPVVVLAGGRGTRLGEATSQLPKPMLPIGGLPILWHVMRFYRHFGHRRFVVCLGYRSDLIKHFFLSYRERMADVRVDLSGQRPPSFLTLTGTEDWDVICAETGPVTETGGRLSRVRRYLDGDTFMCAYGDSLGEVDLAALLAFHRGHGRIATVTGVAPPSRYGELEIEGDAVVEFNEKPATARGVVSGGFFVFDRAVFDYLDDDEGLVLERGPLRELARDGQLAVYRDPGFWLSMDTSRDLSTLNELWDTGKAPWKVWAE
ncbi:MAG: glucose-phosphate cytidylyltransferase [Actinomycetota bacterium]|nr:glucose-phosphate cytidylyltransferase [Actinomycetota bacterium]